MMCLIPTAEEFKEVLTAKQKFYVKVWLDGWRKRFGRAVIVCHYRRKNLGPVICKMNGLDPKELANYEARLLQQNRPSNIYVHAVMSRRQIIDVMGHALPLPDEGMCQVLYMEPNGVCSFYQVRTKQ